MINLNAIDNNFNEFVHKIKNMSLEEIFNNMKINFSKINLEVQISIQKFVNDFGYWGNLNLLNNDYEEIYLKAKSLFEHIEKYEWLYDNLYDYTSKKLLYSILNNWYEYDFRNLKDCMHKTFSHYFDLDLIPDCQDMVFVDVGAYIGDTTLDFINNYIIYKKIYCYEMTNETLTILKNNLSKYKNIIYRNKAVSEFKSIKYIKSSSIDSSANQLVETGEKEIETVCLDEDILEKIDIIKMDIEGEEYKALLGTKNHIIKDKPILLISVYHNNDDLWKIPELIASYNDYKFYLRNYGGNIYPTEIVLIAIPK